MTAAVRPRPRSAVYLDSVLDPGSFEDWELPADPPASASAAYRAELAAAAARAGTDESVVAGTARSGGLPVAVVCSEFGFLGGSLGTGAARRVAAAVERATALRLPLLLAPSSGGTRMQEGAPAFLRMVGIADRVAAHRRAGLPVLVHLRHPTTGGAFASWGSLGSITLAEPGALVGFLGPKVYRALHGTDFPAGVQTAENLHAHGVVDAVLPAAEAAEVLRRVVRLTTAPTPAPPAGPAASAGPAGPAPAGSPAATGGPGRAAPVGASPAPGPDAVTAAEPDAWSSVLATRRPGRPGVRELLDRHAREVVELHGSGTGAPAGTTVVCLARIGGRACVLVGQDRSRPGPTTVGDLRAARRGMTLAGELRLPLVTVVDTAGAELSAAAESSGLAREIAHCLADLTALPVPTVSVLCGQGSGGGALALLPADRVVAARHAWLTPLPPEGASAIVHGTADRAAEVVATQRIRSSDLAAAGAVDRLVAEYPDAADEPGAFVARLAEVIAQEIGVAAARPAGQRIRAAFGG